MRDFLILGNSCDSSRKTRKAKLGDFSLVLKGETGLLENGPWQWPGACSETQWSELCGTGHCKCVPSGNSIAGCYYCCYHHDYLYCMSAQRPQLKKGCHCTEHCINIVRSSFAMNNLCLMALGNVKTKGRNSGPEGRDWALNAWLCFPVLLWGQGLCFKVK